MRPYKRTPSKPFKSRKGKSSFKDMSGISSSQRNNSMGPKSKKTRSPFNSQVKSRQSRIHISTMTESNRKFMSTRKSKNLMKKKVETEIETLYDPMIYSSMLYKYHNNTVSKVGSKMKMMKKNMKKDIKQHSEKKDSKIFSHSRSARKRKKQVQQFIQRTMYNRLARDRINKQKNIINGKFETFRKIPENKKIPHRARGKSSIYETIKRMDRCSNEKTSRGPFKKFNLVNRPNLSIKKAKLLRDISESATLKDKSRRKFLNSREVLKKKRKARIVISQNKRKNKIIRGRSVKEESSKQFLKRKISNFTNERQINFHNKLKKMRNNVQKEYDISLKNPRIALYKFQDSYYNNSNAKSFYNGRKSKLKTSTFDSRVSNDTIKLGVLKHSKSRNIPEALVETTRFSSLAMNQNLNNYRTNKKLIENSSVKKDINQLLLDELQQSKSQNMKFAEIINQLQTQIKMLKNDKSNHFSFKNLSDRSQNRSPIADAKL